MAIIKEGEPIDVETVIEIPFKNDKPIFPITKRSPEDPFIKRIVENNKKWAIITDTTGEPRLALNSDDFLRSALSKKVEFNPLKSCHRPIIFRDSETSLGEAISRLKVYPERLGDDVIDDDIILYWGDEEHRIITGSDILGRLLRGIAQQEGIAYQKMNIKK